MGENNNTKTSSDDANDFNHDIDEDSYLVYQLSDNITVQVNPDLERLYIAEAVGNDFSHPNYANDSNEITRLVRNYFLK